MGILTQTQYGLNFLGTESYIQADGSTKVTILSNGNVGIGATAPDAPLTVHSSTDPEIRFGYSSTQDHRIQWDSSKVYIHADPENANASSAIALYVDGGAKLYIPDSGNVGIGTTAPVTKLVAMGSIGFGGGDYNGGVFANSSSTVIDENWGFEVQRTSNVDDYNTRLKYYPVSNGARKAGIYNSLTSSFSLYSDSNNNPNIIIPDGKLGIGTTNPSAKLNIGSAYNDAFVLTDGRTAANTSTFDSSIVWDTFYSDAAKITLTHNDFNTTYRRLHFDIGGNELMSIKANGNVGIGTSSPLSGTNNYGLHLDRGDHSTIILGDPLNNSHGGFVQTSDNKHRVVVAANVYDDRTGSWSVAESGKGHAGISMLADTGNWGTNMYFWAGDTDTIQNRMVILSNGNVGIGTTNPGYNLTVDNDALNTNNPALYVKNPNSSTAAVIAEFVGDSDSIQIKNIGTGDYAIYNSQQSNGIALFDGTGGVEIHYNGATVLEADSNGGVKVTGQLSATGDVVAYSSDERLKENIKPIESAVDKIKQLKGVTFDWNEKSEELGFEPSTKTNDVGVIAQDVEAVFPQLVQLAPFDIGSDEDGNATSKSGEDYKTVNYARLTAVLIEAVKEQQQQIDELKAKLDGITK